MPYHQHPKGCPNYNKSPTCPPQSAYLKDAVLHGIYQYFYLIYTTFDFHQYLLLMQKEHPEWTEHQLKCVLYWQSSIKKILRGKIEEFVGMPLDQYISTKKEKILLLTCGSGFGTQLQSMESSGINVFATLRNNQITIDEKPQDRIILTCLLCSVSKIEVKDSKQNNLTRFFGVKT